MADIRIDLLRGLGERFPYRVELISLSVANELSVPVAVSAIFIILPHLAVLQSAGPQGSIVYKADIAEPVPRISPPAFVQK